MIALEISLVFAAFFLVFFVITSALPVLNRHLLVPATVLYVAFHLFSAGACKISSLNKILWDARDKWVSSVKGALGFDVLQLVSWLCTFTIYLLAVGLFTLIFELVLRERFNRAYRKIDRYLNMNSVGYMFTTASIFIPLIILAGMYFRFMSSNLMFILVLFLSVFQMESLHSSSKDTSVKMEEKSTLFPTFVACFNITVFFSSMVFLLIR